MFQMIEESAEYIRGKTGFEPEIGIILGTGLGELAAAIQAEHVIEYTDLPHFPVSTVESHKGRLILGTLAGRRVVAMQGRFHYYEGYTMQEIVLPVRVMKLLGVHTLMVSNAAGSLVPEIKAGDMMILDDHINLLPANPLTGKNIGQLGPRFPDMSQPYDRELISQAKEIAARLGHRVHTGTYVAVTGPNLETAAEYRFLRIIGAHIVGMSTIPEIIAANHCGLRCFAISVVTDECFNYPIHPLTLEQVVAVAGRTEPKMTALLKALIAEA